MPRCFIDGQPALDYSHSLTLELIKGQVEISHRTIIAFLIRQRQKVTPTGIELLISIFLVLQSSLTQFKWVLVAKP